MTIHISKDEILNICGVTSSSPTQGAKLTARGAEYDSREIRGGELFVALKGDQSHGHAFLKSAYERGAALFLVEDFAIAAACIPETDRIIVVPDSLAAFWKIATFWRRSLKLPILAITGSVGKTTTKELSARILLELSSGSYSTKSFNNHVGVPYSLCNISAEHHWAVLEMGMNHAGEIRNLTRMGEPNVALITSIAPAHIENLGSIRGIAQAKLEIVEGLAEGAPLVLTAHSPELQALVQERALEKHYAVHYFGERERHTKEGLTAPLSASVSNVLAVGTEQVRFTLELFGESREVTLAISGAHNAQNCAGAALSAKLLCPALTIDQVVSGLHKFVAPLQRSRSIELSAGRVLIDDSYNANPASMSAMLQGAAQSVRAGKKVGLVLGDMFELGTFAERYHREIGVLVAEIKPAFLIAVGPLSRFYVEECRGALGVEVEVEWAESPEEAAKLASARDFELLYVKASRGMKLERCVAEVVKCAA